MSIKETKKEIDEMEELYSHEQQGSGFNRSELKPLADSHTALLEVFNALKAVREAESIGEEYDAKQRLETAIEKAEQYQ
jgi:hypothetical protein